MPIIQLLKYSVASLLITHISFNYAADSLKTDKDKQSYAVGYNFGKNLKEQKVPLDSQKFFEGFRAGFGENKSLLSEQKVRQYLNELNQQMQQQQQERQSVEGKKNQEKGQQYLAKNRQKEGVIETQSGLQYRFIKKGSGQYPKASDKVKVHYQGNFINGEEFDSSYKRGQPSSFRLNQVIRGWTEVLQLMPVGSKIEVAIPGDLAYGKKARPSIGPNRLLIFQIELLGIE